MCENLLIWQAFFSSFNGVRFWHQDLCLEAELQVSSDAGSFDFGGYFHASEWPQVWVVDRWTRDLTLLEFFPVWMVICIWGKKMDNQTGHFWCDNMATVRVISSLISKSRVINLV